MAKTNDSIQHATDTTQQAHDSVAQFNPLYPDGIPAVQGNDSVVSHLADLPVMESPKGTASVTHSRGPLYDTGSMSLLLSLW